MFNAIVNILYGIANACCRSAEWFMPEPIDEAGAFDGPMMIAPQHPKVHHGWW